MIRLARWDVAASTFASTPADARGDRTIDRLSAPVRGPGFWLALWAVAIGAEFAALVPVIWPGEEPVETVQVIYRLIGGSFAACGLIAWRRRPDSRSGLLMAGGRRRLLPIGHHRPVRRPDRADRSILVQEMWAPFFVALLLTLLTGGRLASRVDWLLVGAFVLALWVLQVVWLLFYEQDGNLLAAFPNADIADAVDKGQRSLAGLACVAVAIVVAVRWTAASRPRRRALLPSVAGSVALLLFAALLTNDLVTGSRSQTVLWLAICSLVSVPAAFLVGLLRSRLARGGLADLFRDLQEHARHRPAGRRWPRRSATRASSSPTASPGPWATPTPTGARCWCPRSPKIAPPRWSRATAPSSPRSSTTPRSTTIPSWSRPSAPRRAWRSRTSTCRPRRSRGSPRCRPRASASWRPATPSAGAWSATCTTAPSSAWSPCRCSCACWRAAWATTHPRRSSSPPRARSWPSRSPSCASSRAGSTPPSSTTASPLRWTRSPRGRRCPTSVTYEANGPLPEPVELAAYFVASEALTNVAKYAQATAASVRVSHTPTDAVIEIADDGVGGADELARLGAARSGRSRRGARRAADASSARRAPGPPSPRSCRAGRDRGRQHPRPRGHRLDPDPRGDRGRGAGGLAGRAARRGRRPRARRGHRRRPHAADADRRRAARGARDPRAPPADRHRHPLPARRGRHRDAPAGRDARGPWLPAQGPRRRTSRPSSARWSASPTAARRSTPRW